MEKITKDEKLVAERLLREPHFSRIEKKLLMSIAHTSHYVVGEKERFNELVRLHKFILN